MKRVGISDRNVFAGWNNMWSCPLIGVKDLKTVFRNTSDKNL